MNKTTKRIGISDLGKMAIIFENYEIEKYQIVIGDKIEIGEMLHEK